MGNTDSLCVNLLNSKQWTLLKYLNRKEKRKQKTIISLHYWTQTQKSNHNYNWMNNQAKSLFLHLFYLFLEQCNYGSIIKHRKNCKNMDAIPQVNKICKRTVLTNKPNNCWQTNQIIALKIYLKSHTTTAASRCHTTAAASCFFKFIFRTVKLRFRKQAQKEVQKHGYNSTSKQNLQKNCADKATK